MNDDIRSLRVSRLTLRCFAELLLNIQQSFSQSHEPNSLELLLPEVSAVNRETLTFLLNHSDRISIFVEQTDWDDLATYFEDVKFESISGNSFNTVRDILSSHFSVVPDNKNYSGVTLIASASEEISYPGDGRLLEPEVFLPEAQIFIKSLDIVIDRDLASLEDLLAARAALLSLKQAAFSFEEKIFSLEEKRVEFEKLYEASDAPFSEVQSQHSPSAEVSAAPDDAAGELDTPAEEETEQEAQSTLNQDVSVSEPTSGAVPQRIGAIKQYQEASRMMKKVKKMGKKGLMRQGLSGLMPPGGGFPQ